MAESKADFTLKKGMRGTWSSMDQKWLLMDRNNRVLASSESKTDLIKASRHF